MPASAMSRGPVGLRFTQSRKLGCQAGACYADRIMVRASNATLAHVVAVSKGVSPSRRGGRACGKSRLWGRYSLDREAAGALPATAAFGPQQAAYAASGRMFLLSAMVRVTRPCSSIQSLIFCASG